MNLGALFSRGSRGSRDSRGSHGSRGAGRARNPRRPSRAADSARVLAVRIPPWRSRVLLLTLFAAFSALTVRAFYLQAGFSTRFLQRQGEARYAHIVKEAPVRGTIYDRNGVVLAASVPARGVWVDPDHFDADPAQRALLSRQLDLPADELRRRVSMEKRQVYLRHQLDPEVAHQVEGLQIAGLHTDKEFRRQYSEGPVTSHILGITNFAEQGQEGIERAFDAMLGGQPGLRHLVEDPMHHTLEDTWLREPVQGQDITLALDDRIQYIAHSAVRKAAEDNAARAAAAVVLDARTGELMGMASWPDFDPAKRAQFDPDQARNRAVADLFEPGSTLKPFSIATAIETGLVRPDTLIDTGAGRMAIGGRTISDTHAHGVISVEQVVAMSSNVGTATIALRMPAQNLWDTLTGAGFGQVPQHDLVGARAGVLRSAASWRPVEKATIAYGYGISVSLLQLARAYMIFARDGDILPISVLRTDAPPPAVRVISPETAAKMRHMLEMATSDQGTAPLARVPGYRVAGKTGTARKLHDGKYIDAYVSSFVGFAPVSDPRIVVAVMIDEPHGGHYFGGDVAAPAFSAIVGGTLLQLRVPSDAAAPAAVVSARSTPPSTQPSTQLARAAAPGG